jgi:L-rhamnonate dehydratase
MIIPLQEYLIKWNVIHQWFRKTPVEPKNGVVMPADTPGLGMELDEARIEEQRPLSWTETRWS